MNQMNWLVLCEGVEFNPLTGCPSLSEIVEQLNFEPDAFGGSEGPSVKFAKLKPPLNLIGTTRNTSDQEQDIVFSLSIRLPDGTVFESSNSEPMSLAASKRARFHFKLPAIPLSVPGDYELVVVISGRAAGSYMLPVTNEFEETERLFKDKNAKRPAPVKKAARKSTPSKRD